MHYRGYGDYHETKYDKFRRAISVTAPEFYTENSPHYTLALYPSDQLYDVYSTHNPMTATIGAVFVIIFMSILFFVYDFLVRREFSAKKDLLAAKRSFMRFVSHEVRTPLNAVCMGLSVIQTEMAQSLGCKSVDELEAIAAEEEEQQKPLVHRSAPAAMSPSPLFAISSPTQQTTVARETEGADDSCAQATVPSPAPLFALPPSTTMQKESNSGHNHPGHNPDTTSPPPLFAITTPSSKPAETDKGQNGVDSEPKSALSTAPLFSIKSSALPTSSPPKTIFRGNCGSSPLSEQAVLEWFRLSQDILRNTLSAVDVLSDVLNYDKIESGSLTLELAKIPIWKLIEDSIKEFRLSAQRKNIDFQLDFRVDSGDNDIDPSAAKDEEAAPPTTRQSLVAGVSRETLDCKVIGDQVRIIQVIRNLISNALKFTPAEGSVHVTATWHKPKLEEPTRKARRIHLAKGDVITLAPKGTVTVAVQDTGAGLTRRQLQYLFREGMQFNANELQQGKGSGFGLFIAKGIVEMHEGNLVAESEGLGRGTTFTMTLPLYHSPNKDPSQNGLESSFLQSAPDLDMDALSTLNVLVVDDAVSNRKLLTRLLQNAGHSCDQADDGSIALQMVLDKMSLGGRYDTVLLDYEMPNMNGPTCAKELRRNGSDAFIVGITGNMLPEDVSYFVSCGANAVLAKPLKLSDLEDLWMEHDVVSRTIATTTTPTTLASTTTTTNEEESKVPV